MARRPWSPTSPRSRGRWPTRSATAGATSTRYVGSHPMAGRERSGAGAARGDLFDGRAWVVVPTGTSRAGRRRPRPPGGHRGRRRRERDGRRRARRGRRRGLARAPGGGQPRRRPAARRCPTRRWPWPGRGCATSPGSPAATRGSWTQILAGNAAAVRDVLTALRADLDEVIGALDQLADGDGRGALEVREPRPSARATSATRGSRASTARRPPHTRPSWSSSRTRRARWAGCSPTIGEAGVNLEDLHLEHGLGQPFGLAEVAVRPRRRRAAAGRPRGPGLARP